MYFNFDGNSKIQEVYGHLFHHFNYDRADIIEDSYKMRETITNIFGKRVLFEPLRFDDNRVDEVYDMVTLGMFDNIYPLLEVSTCSFIELTENIKHHYFTFNIDDSSYTYKEISFVFDTKFENGYQSTENSKKINPNELLMILDEIAEREKKFIGELNFWIAKKYFSNSFVNLMGFIKSNYITKINYFLITKDLDNDIKFIGEDYGNMTIETRDDMHTKLERLDLNSDKVGIGCITFNVSPILSCSISIINYTTNNPLTGNDVMLKLEYAKRTVYGTPDEIKEHIKGFNEYNYPIQKLKDWAKEVHYDPDNEEFLKELFLKLYKFGNLVDYDPLDISPAMHHLNMPISLESSYNELDNYFRLNAFKIKLYHNSRCVFYPMDSMFNIFTLIKYHTNPINNNESESYSKIMTRDELDAFLTQEYTKNESFIRTYRDNYDVITPLLMDNFMNNMGFVRDKNAFYTHTNNGMFSSSLEYFKEISYFEDIHKIRLTKKELVRPNYDNVICDNDLIFFNQHICELEFFDGLGTEPIFKMIAPIINLKNYILEFFDKKK